MTISRDNLFDLFKVTWDSAPPELKARVLAMQKQLEQERQERMVILTAIEEAFGIVHDLRSLRFKLATRVAVEWAIKYDALNLYRQIKKVFIGEED